jgi:hypothetical protein
MAYLIQTTDGTVITTITDGDIDNTTSLTLFGKSYSGFGEALNENLVKLLENSALGTQPASPLRGELWFDTTVNQLKVYDGADFKPTGGAKSQSSAPTSPSAGDLWLNTTNGQLFVRTGQTYAWQTFSGWELAGPVYTSGQTLSGFKIETITDNSAISKVIASMYSGNTRVAILSAEGFTPGAAITGFATISAGLTLNSAIGAQFAGTTTTASNLNTSVTTGQGIGGATTVGGGNFMRKDVAQTTTGAITIAADTGLIVGAGSDLRLTVSGIDATIANVSEDGNLSFQIKDGSETKTPIAITGSSGNIALTGDVTITGNLTISGSYDKSSVDVSTYVDAFIGVNEGNNTNVDGGIIVEQNSGVEARLFWDQSEGYWSAGKSNTTYSQIIRFDDAVTDSDANKGKVLKTTGAGNVKVTSLTLGAVGSNIATSDTSNLNVPTTGQVAESIKRWGGTAITPDAGSTGNTVAGNRYIELVAPIAGTNDAGTSDGDLWFVREA